MELIKVLVDVLYEQEIKEMKLLISEAEEELQISDQAKQEIQNIGLSFGRGYAKWVIMRLKDRSLKEEDLYKYPDYFRTFEKGKRLGYFTNNDIMKYRNADEFTREVAQAHNKLIGFKGETLKQDEKYLVSPSQIEKLKSVGIEFLGLTPDGYQVFKIPQHLSGSKEAFEAQKAILGRCQGREHGASIAICTLGGQGHFDNHLKQDDLYVFFNLKDPLSPYQFHYASNQFKDKDNHDV